MRVLVIDVGGSNIKFTVWRSQRILSFPSGPTMTAAQAVKQVLAVTHDWKYDVVSIGFPGVIIRGKITVSSIHLGNGWIGFSFGKHFHKPVKLINDAAMQALGSYRSGRVLFLGLGTGLGSTLILDGVIIPLALGDLAYSKKWTLGEMIGKKGLQRIGRPAWESTVHRAITSLAKAFRTDHVVLGGGNVKQLRRVPAGSRRGDNDYAFIGGARLWGLAGAHAKPGKKHTWIIA